MAARLALGLLVGLAAAVPAVAQTSIPTPIATTDRAGKVKPDGSTITVTGDGTISAAGGGSGCLVSGAAGIVLNDGASGCTTDTSALLTGGALSLGASGTVGSVTLGNATSGTLKLQAVTGALGTVIVSLPAATDTLVGKATTDTLTNKTLTSPTIAAGALSGTFSGSPTFSGTAIVLSGAATGTQDRCLGLTSGNVLATSAGACGAGGGAVSLTAATPNIIVTPDPITGTGTIGTTAPLHDISGGGAAIVTGDATKTVSLGAFTYTLAQAGSAGFATGWSACLLNVGASAATINATTSVFKGAGGTTSLSLLPGATACPTSDGTDYVTESASGSSSTGTGNVVRAASPTLTAPSLGTPSALVLTNATGLPISQIGASPASHAVPVDVAGTSTYKVVPDCTDTGGNHINFTQSTDAFSCGTSAGAAGGGGLLQYSDNGLTLTAGTRYVPVGGSGTPSTTEADYSTKAPSALTVNNLQVNLSADPGAGQTLVVTLRKAGADQTLTCTVTGGGGAVCQDLTHSVSVAQNDLIDWKVVTTGTFVATPSLTILANSGTTNNGITGSGTANTVTKFTGSASAGNSSITDDGTTVTMTAGVVVAGASGTLGSLKMGNATSGTVTLAPVTGALGTVTASLPANTGTIAELNLNQSWTAGQAVTPDTATQCGTQSAAGTMTPNFALSNSCVATFGAGNLTIANPTNVKAGQTWLLSLTQDGTGSRTVTWGSQYKWAGGTAPTLSTAASSKDVISCFSDTTTTHNCVLAVKGAS